MSATAALHASATARASPRAATLAVEDLRQVYGSRVAVDGVRWRAEAGEIVCLLGHSGCGKTTLLRLIAGIEAPAAGRILIDDQVVSDAGRFVPAEQRRVGLVFQDYALFPNLSVLANVTFGLRDGSRTEREAIAHGLLQRVGLDALAAHYPHTLSGGEQQRVALARALAPQPRLLLMDEPFSNLDRRLRDRVRDDTMALLRESGTTAVIVTHDPEEALRIADRIVLMHGGRVEQNGCPEALYRRPATLFAARFFSELNEIPGVCRGDSVETPLGRFAAPGLADGARATVCLRPQDLRLGDTGPTATVVERRFLGDAEELRLRVAGLESMLTLRHLGDMPDLAVGQTAHLDLRRDDALVFPT
jgi:iron(III) transport system ATP-binding protein